MTTIDADNHQSIPSEARDVNLDEFAGMTPAYLIGFYVALRDRIDAENKAHKDRMAKANTTLNKLNAKMLEILEAGGATSIKSEHGTVYRTMKKSATVGDMDTFRNFVINNQAFELVDMRANATTVEDYCHEHNGNLPPGVNFSQFATVGVRRGTAKPGSEPSETE